MTRWILLVAMVLAAFAACADPDAAAPERQTPMASQVAALDGPTRTVSRRGVSVDMPATWVDDREPGPDWCAFDRGRGKPPFPTTPYVAIDTTYGGVLSIGCIIENGAPTAFGSVPEKYWAPHVALGSDPDGIKDGTHTYRGWTLTIHTVDGVQVRLLTNEDTADLREPILQSIRASEDGADGCASTSPAQAVRFVRPEPAFDVEEIKAVDSISVCQYARGAGTDRPGLLGTRLIEGDEARDVLAAIQQAPKGGGPDAPQHCLSTMYGDTALVLRLHTGDTAHDIYAYSDWCFGNGFDDGTARRELTAAACRPLWGGQVQQFSGSSEPFRRCHA